MPKQIAKIEKKLLAVKTARLTKLPAIVPAEAPKEPLYVRLPKQGTLCPWTGLTRGKLWDLCVQGKVKHFVVPNAFKNQKGCRLLVWASVRDYLKSIEQAAEAGKAA